jgi:hypothetical protein
MSNIVIPAATTPATSSPELTLRYFVFLPEPQATLDGGYDTIIFERSDDNGVTFTTVAPEDGGQQTVAANTCNYTLVISDAIPGETVLRAFLRDSTNTNPDLAPLVQEGVDTSYEAVLTVEELKRIYLFGIKLTDDDGNPFPDEMFVHFIRDAISDVSIELDIKLQPQKFDEHYDFYIREYEMYGFLQLRNRPIISVASYTIEYPAGQDVIEFPVDWLRVDRWAGHLQVLPARGTFTQQLVSAGGGFLPLVFGGSDYIPDILHVVYTAGFELGDEGPTREFGLPRAIKEYVGMKAAFGPFNTAGDLIVGAGIAQKSLSFDGLSESVATTASATNSGFGSRLVQYEKQIKARSKKLMSYYKGSRMHVV